MIAQNAHPIQFCVLRTSATKYPFAFMRCSLSEITFFGQAFAQRPQPFYIFSSMVMDAMFLPPCSPNKKDCCIQPPFCPLSGRLLFIISYFRPKRNSLFRQSFNNSCRYEKNRFLFRLFPENIAKESACARVRTQKRLQIFLQGCIMEKQWVLKQRSKNQDLY